MIEEFIDYICGLLDIEVPEIRILKGEALTDTTLACVIDGIVYVKTMKPSPDLCCSLWRMNCGICGRRRRTGICISRITKTSGS